jgi:hypothetical protein
MMRAGPAFAWWGSMAAASVSVCAGCGIDPLHEDPVHQAQVDALGGETSGVPRGPYHRAGQPCTVCHGGEGPASTPFVVAGTIFADPAERVGVSGAEVIFVDSLGSSPPPGSTVTNCVGNFFLTADTWNPAFPIRVAVASGQTVQQMVGHIGRQGSCGFCHKDPRGLDSPGHVFAGVAAAPAAACPASPIAGGPQ